MRRVNPITTNARARHPMPPSRNANGVDVPEKLAANVVLYAMAIAGDSTATDMATASHVVSVPPLSWWDSARSGMSACIRPPFSAAPRAAGGVLFVPDPGTKGLRDGTDTPRSPARQLGPA